MTGQQYPYADDLGTVWIDQGGMFANTFGFCFWCGNMTRRLDVNYGGYFCNSETCNREIAADLFSLSLKDAEAEEVGCE